MYMSTATTNECLEIWNNDTEMAETSDDHRIRALFLYWQRASYVDLVVMGNQNENFLKPVATKTRSWNFLLNNQAIYSVYSEAAKW